MVRLGRCYYRDSSAVPSSWFIICFALLLRHDLFALLLHMACCSVSLSFLTVAVSSVCPWSDCVQILFLFVFLSRLYVVGYRLHVCFKPCLAFELWCLPLSLVPFSSPSFWFVGAPLDVLFGEFVPSKLIDLSFR